MRLNNIACLTASNGAKCLILQTTNTVQVALNSEVPPSTPGEVGHSPAWISVFAKNLGESPPIAVATDIAKIAIGIDITTRHGGKAISIRAFAVVRVIVVPASLCLQDSAFREITANQFRQYTPLRLAWQMPTARTNSHCRFPVVKPAVSCTVGFVVVIAFAATCIVVKILRHPYLLAYFYCFIGLSATRYSVVANYSIWTTT